MSELTDLISELTTKKNSLQNQLDWHNGVEKTYFVGETKSDTSPAEWTGAGRDAFLVWHNAQGVNTTDLDQVFVDMYTERTSTENGSPANAIEQNADTPTVLQTSIDEITTDLQLMQLPQTLTTFNLELMLVKRP